MYMKNESSIIALAADTNFNKVEQDLPPGFYVFGGIGDNALMLDEGIAPITGMSSESAGSDVLDDMDQLAFALAKYPDRRGVPIIGLLKSARQHGATSAAAYVANTLVNDHDAQVIYVGPDTNIETLKDIDRYLSKPILFFNRGMLGPMLSVTAAIRDMSVGILIDSLVIAPPTTEAELDNVFIHQVDWIGRSDMSNLDDLSDKEMHVLDVIRNMYLDASKRGTGPAAVFDICIVNRIRRSLEANSSDDDKGRAIVAGLGDVSRSLCRLASLELYPRRDMADFELAYTVTLDGNIARLQGEAYLGGHHSKSFRVEIPLYDLLGGNFHVRNFKLTFPNVELQVDIFSKYEKYAGHDLFTDRLKVVRDYDEKGCFTINIG